MKARLSLIGAALALTGGTALAQSQGVSKDQIVLGSIQDLSGPIAGFGKQVRLGMMLRVDEVNEQGGVNGRKVKLLVEDSAYDPRRAVLAAQKLVNQDKIFAMVGHIGTAQNMAAMPVQFQKNVINFFPVTAAREMYEPFHKLKYSFAAPYFDQMKIAVPKLVKDKGAKKVCTMYQDDEFGLEVKRGAEEGLKSIGMTLAEETSYKRGATDFASQMQKLQASQCDMVVLGTIIRETVGVIGEARKSGYSPVFLGSSASYSELIPKLGGKLVEGMYATMTAQIPYVDDASQPVRFWASKYKTQFNEDPSAMSVFGYNTLNVFAQAMRDAGPRPTTSKFIRSMETIRVPGDIFGGPPLKFTPSKRLGSNASRMSQIQDGRWKVVSGYKAP